MVVAATANAATTRVRIVWHAPLLILKVRRSAPSPRSAYTTKSARETPKINQVFPYAFVCYSAVKCQRHASCSGSTASTPLT